MEGDICRKNDILIEKSKNPPEKNKKLKNRNNFQFFCPRSVVWVKILGLSLIQASISYSMLKCGSLNVPNFGLFSVVNFQAFSSPALCFSWGRTHPVSSNTRDNLTVGRETTPDWVRMSQDRIIPSFPKWHFLTLPRR